MNIVITGATGFVGLPLLNALSTKGHRLIVLSRNAENAKKKAPFVERAENWKSETELAPSSALKGADAIIHLAGESLANGYWTRSKKISIRESRIRSTRNLVEAIARLDPADRPKRMISTSAIGFYGDCSNVALDENAKSGDDFLATLCKDWEAEAHRAQSLGVSVAVVRTGIVLGQNGGALEKMIQPFRRGLGAVLGSGKQFMSVIHLDDLVGIYVFLAERTDLEGAFNGVCPNPIEHRAFAATLASTLKKKLLPAHVPALALKLALGEMSTLVLSSQRVFPKRALEAHYEFRYPTLESALSDLIQKRAP